MTTAYRWGEVLSTPCRDECGCRSEAVGGPKEPRNVEKMRESGGLVSCRFEPFRCRRFRPVQRNNPLPQSFQQFARVRIVQREVFFGVVSKNSEPGLVFRQLLVGFSSFGFEQVAILDEQVAGFF